MQNQFRNDMNNMNSYRQVVFNFILFQRLVQQSLLTRL